MAHPLAERVRRHADQFNFVRFLDDAQQNSSDTSIHFETAVASEGVAERRAEERNHDCDENEIEHSPNTLR